MDYLLYLKEQQAKLNAAYDVAHASLIDTLEHDGKRRDVNALIQDHVHIYNQQTDTPFPLTLFDIEPFDIDELKRSRTDLCVTEKQMINNDVRRIRNLMVIGEPGHHVILANPGVVDHLSMCELQKTLIHELGHMLHMPRIMLYFHANQLAEDTAKHHLFECMADCISDMTQILPPVAEVQQKLLLYRNETADTSIQKRMQNSYDLVQKQCAIQGLATPKQNGASLTS